MKKHLLTALQWAGFGAILLSLSLLLWVNYALYWPVRTLEISNLSPDMEVQTDALTYKFNQTVGYKLDYCKYTTAPVSVKRTLVDGQIISLSNSTGYLPGGCHSTLVETAEIPDTINPGKYYLDVEVTYHINIFRDETVHYHTNYFQVIR